MASPQIENGYTKIANEIIDVLIKKCPGFSEGQVLFAVIRKTYGWQKKEDAISISQLCDMTKLSRRTVIYAVHNLEAKNMIVVKRKKIDLFNEINMIGFQKDYDKWVVQEIDGSARKCKSYKLTIEKQKEKYNCRVVQEIVGSARNGFESQNLAPTKETNTKENNTKELVPLNSFDSFYSAYPKHISKKAAIKAWEKLKPSVELIGIILTFIKQAKTSVEWTQDNGKYIPYPATFLNGRKWEDELTFPPKAWNE